MRGSARSRTAVKTERPPPRKRAPPLPRPKLTSPAMTVDFETIIRQHALSLVDKIKEMNKAIRKTDGYQIEIGRNIAFAISLGMLLNRLKFSGANLDEMGLGGIDPVGLVEAAPKAPDPPPSKRWPYRKRRCY